MTKRVTIKDVAKDAGVSITSASFALNNVKGRVSKEIRERVLASAAKLHYTANNSARSLRTDDSRTIMFVFSKEYLIERTSGYMASLSGCVEYAEGLGRSILLELIDIDMSMDEQIERFLRIWESRRVNGMIFQCYFEDDRDDEFYRKLYQAGVNLVNISRIGNSSDYPCVFLEEFQITRDQVRYAVGKGYDMLYYLCRKHRSLGIRERGFLDEIEGEGVRGELVHYTSINVTEEELWEVVAPLIAAHHGERIAFLCWNDMDAMLLMNVLRKHNISIPAQVGVMGFDDMPMAEYLVPKLTTVTQPFAEMARHALQILDRAEKTNLDPDRVVERINVSGEIVERDSM